MSIDEIEQFVDETFDDTVEFTKIAVAKEYRDSLAMDEVEPTDEELEILDAFESRDSKYAPDTSMDDLKKELGL